MLALLFGVVASLFVPTGAQTPGYDWNGFTATTLGCGTDSGALNVGLGQSLSPGATGLKVKQIAFAIYGTQAMPANIQLDGNPSTARLSTSGIQSCCAPNCDLAVQVAAAGQTWYNSPCGVNSCGGSSSQNHWYYMDFSSSSVGTIEQTGIGQATFYDGSGNQIGADMVNIANRGSAFFMSYTEIIPSSTPTPSVTKSPVSPSLTASITASASTDPTDTVSSTLSRSISLSTSITATGSRSASVQGSSSKTPSTSVSQSRQASTSVSPSVQASKTGTPSRTPSYTPSPTISPTPNLNFNVITVAGMGNVVQADGIGTAASVPFPQYMTFTQDYTGVYISESSYADQIRLLNLTTAKVISIAGMWDIQDTGTGVGTNAAMNSPAGLALDGPNNILYAVERDANLIRSINLTDFTLQYIVGNPEAGPGCVDGIGTNALLTTPEGLTIDQVNQFLYVADTGCNAIRAVNISSLTITTVAGQLGIPGWQESYGVGQPGKFWSPTGIRYNNMHLYVTDTHWNNIRYITLASPGLIASSQNILGGNGPPNTSIDGSGTGVSFNNPMDLEYDPTNNVLYVSQTGTNQNVIRKITLNSLWNANVLTLIGNNITQSIDGTGTQVSFNSPIGVVYNPSANNLYVADSVGNKIRRIALTIPLPTQSVSSSISSTLSASSSVSATGSSSATPSSSATASSSTSLSSSVSSAITTTVSSSVSASIVVTTSSSVSSTASNIVTSSSSVSATTSSSTTISLSTSLSITGSLSMSLTVTGTITPSLSASSSTSVTNSIPATASITPSVTQTLPPPWFTGMTGCCHNSMINGQAVSFTVPSYYSSTSISSIAIQYWPGSTGSTTFNIGLMAADAAYKPTGSVLASAQVTLTSPGTFPSVQQQAVLLTNLGQLVAQPLAAGATYSLVFYGATNSNVQFLVGNSGSYIFGGGLTPIAGYFYTSSSANPPLSVYWFSSPNTAYLEIYTGPVQSVSTSPSTTLSGSQTASSSATGSSSATLSPSLTLSSTLSRSATSSLVSTLTPTTTVSISNSIAGSGSNSASVSVSNTVSNTVSVAGSVSTFNSASVSGSVSGSVAGSVSASNSASVSGSVSGSVAGSVSASNSGSNSVSVSGSVTGSNSVSISVTQSLTKSLSFSPSFINIMSLSGTPIPNLFANASASASFNSTGGAAAAAAADSGVLAVVLGAVSLGLVGVMGAVMGTNAIRRSGVLNFLPKVGVSTNPDGSINTSSVSDTIEDLETKSPTLSKIGSFVNTVRTQSAKFKNTINNLPLPDSVKSLVNDPTKMLPKSAQDKLNAMESAMGIQATDDTPDTMVKVKSSPSLRKVAIQPTPTVKVDMGVRLPSVKEVDDSLDNELVDNSSHDNCPTCVAKAKTPTVPSTSPVEQPDKPLEQKPSFSPDELKKHLDMLKQYISTQTPVVKTQPPKATTVTKSQPPPPPPKAKSPPPPPPRAKSPPPPPPPVQKPKPQPKAKIEVNAAELAEIKAILAAKNKHHKVVG